MISVSLAKLSTAQDTNPDEHNFQWTHENNNLTCVIDSYQAGGSALQLLKVVQGTQLREQIDIERLINEANDLAGIMQQRGIELKGEQLPISAIVRCPLLAIRWQLSNQKVRRLQMRFRLNEDFDNVYNHLRHLGLRMSPPQSQPKDQDSSLRVEQLKNGRSPPFAARSMPQPTGLSCPPSRLAEISSRPYTAASAPTAPESQIRDTVHGRPSSAFPNSSFTSANPLTPPMYFTRPDSASVASPEDGFNFPPRNRSVATIEQQEAVASRPATTLLYDRPDAAELPPRRELPFQRDSLPRSSGSDSNQPRSRPSTAVMGPPPLPSRVSDLRPSSARTASLDSELPPLRQPTIVTGATKIMPIQERVFTPPMNTSCSKPTQFITVHDEHKNIQQSPTSPRACPISFTSSSTTTPRSAVSSDAQNQGRSSSSGSFPSSHHYGSRAKNNCNPEPVLFSDSEAALKAYARQSDDERRAALNDFIFKSLDSNDFLTLAEDMETNWARLGLGMW